MPGRYREPRSSKRGCPGARPYGHYPRSASVQLSSVTPPLAPMLGRRVDELPAGDWIYEPKWDGFRCLAFRAGAEIDMRSRHDRPLARYFPELVGDLRELRA